MANWQLRGHRELTEPATVRPPSILEDVGPLPSAILAHLGRRLATKGAVDSAFVVIIAKRARFPLQVQRIPEQRLVEKLSTYRSDQALNEGLAVSCLFVLLEQAAASRRKGSDTKDPHSPWHTLPAWRSNMSAADVIVLHIGERDIRVPVRHEGDGFVLTLPAGATAAHGRLLDNGELRAVIGARQLHVDVVRDGNDLDVFFAGKHLRVRCEDRDHPGNREDTASGLLVAPMPGRVIAVLVDRDASVEKGQALMVIEAMKMEHTIHAPVDGTVTAVAFGEGDLVEEGVELLVIAPAG